MKIYHLCPSGSLWIFNQKEVESREKGEALFQKQSKEGDFLKIDIPGQDTIKIVKLININKKSMSKKSQLAIQDEEKKKEQEKKQQDYTDRANNFMKEYTALTDKYRIFLNAQLEFSVDGVNPKIVLQNKVVPINPAPQTPGKPIENK
jgi:hypothetical protein